MDYPKMLYCFPARGDSAQLQDGAYGTLIVGDQEAEASALDAGYFPSHTEARYAFNNPPKPEEPAEGDIDPVEEDAAVPTRAELEQKASELGIKFDGRTSDKTLAHRISEALKA